MPNAQTDNVRSFIAVELPEEVRRLLARTQESLRRALGPAEKAIKWVEPGNIHLTIQFLGDVPSREIDPVIAALQSSARGVRPANLEVSGLGVFPNPRRPRVIWVGLAGDIGTLHALERALGSELQPLGFAPDKPFSPHLTLGRVREHTRPGELSEIESLLSQPATRHLSPCSFVADSVSLMKSDLRPMGPIYTQLANVPFR